MCRKLVVTNQIFLGTRAICYEAYSLPKGEVIELTEKQIKDALKGITTDEVYGLALSDAGELVLDTDNFYAGLSSKVCKFFLHLFPQLSAV